MTKNISLFSEARYLAIRSFYFYRKKKISVFHYLIILLFLSAANTHAQKIDNLFFAATTEAYAFPFTRALPVHPGLEIGTTLWSKEKQKTEHLANVYCGGYYHRKVENAFYLRGEYVYRFKLMNTVGIGLPIGGGYQHAFYPGEVYKQNSETGEWEKINQKGKPHALVNFGLGLTYLKAQKIQPFVRYESVIDFPLYNGFLTTRTFFKLGVNVKFLNNETE